MISLQGIQSKALKFGAGIPQGRKFEVHVFTSVMTFLRDLLNLCCNPAKAVLPDFASDAISAVWAGLTPPPQVHALTPGCCKWNSPEGIRLLMSVAPEQARRQAIHTLATISDNDDRIQFMDACGIAR